MSDNNVTKVTDAKLVECEKTIRIQECQIFAQAKTIKNLELEIDTQKTAIKALLEKAEPARNERINRCFDEANAIAEKLRFTAAFDDMKATTRAALIKIFEASVNLKKSIIAIDGTLTVAIKAKEPTK